MTARRAALLAVLFPIAGCSDGWFGLKEEEDKLPGERVVCHISYSRLAMRVIEDYAADADDLIERHGERMAQLLGRCDSLDSPTGFVYEKVYETFNNAKI